MTTNMHYKMAFSQPGNIPHHLIIWQDENSGIAALVNAAKDIANGEKATFALCNHEEGYASPVIVEIVTIGNDGQSARYCGENDDPSGVGSHALIASWYDYSTSPAHIAVALARAFAAHKCYFRLAPC